MVTTAAATATQQVNLSIVADTQYVATSPNGTEAQVLSQMNIVDGIFAEQIGVQFGITNIQALTSNGPLTSTDPSDLLRQYQTFVGGNNPGLSHLFTGREIDGNVIGIAFLSGICTTSGVGLTQAGGRGTFGALTAAHEFGHNFGAPHDNQAGSACATSPGTFLMNPSINGSDQFSQCSVQQIQNVLSVRNACLVDVDVPAPTPPPTGPIADCNVLIQTLRAVPTGLTLSMTLSLQHTRIAPHQAAHLMLSLVVLITTTSAIWKEHGHVSVNQTLQAKSPSA